jgi:hypothetical protein
MGGSFANAFAAIRLKSGQQLWSSACANFGVCAICALASFQCDVFAIGLDGHFQRR